MQASDTSTDRGLTATAIVSLPDVAVELSSTHHWSVPISCHPFG